MSTETSKGPDEPQYDWNLIDLLLDAMKIVNGCFDKVASEDNNARMAVRKLR